MSTRSEKGRGSGVLRPRWGGGHAGEEVRPGRRPRGRRSDGGGGHEGEEVRPGRRSPWEGGGSRGPGADGGEREGRPGRAGGARPSEAPGSPGRARAPSRGGEREAGPGTSALT